MGSIKLKNHKKFKLQVISKIFNSNLLVKKKKGNTSVEVQQCKSIAGNNVQQENKCLQFCLNGSFSIGKIHEIWEGFTSQTPSPTQREAKCFLQTVLKGSEYYNE